MDLRRRAHGKVVILELVGELDVYSAATFKAALFELADGADSQILLNCTGLEYIDSSGLGVLIATMTRMRRSFGQLRMCAVRDNVRTVLRLTKTERLFDIHESEAQALAAFE